MVEMEKILTVEMAQMLNDMGYEICLNDGQVSDISKIEE